MIWVSDYVKLVILPQEGGMMQTNLFPPISIGAYGAIKFDLQHELQGNWLAQVHSHLVFHESFSLHG